RLTTLRQVSRTIPRKGKQGGGKTWPASFLFFIRLFRAKDSAPNRATHHRRKMRRGSFRSRLRNHALCVAHIQTHIQLMPWFKFLELDCALERPANSWRNASS